MRGQFLAIRKGEEQGESPAALSVLRQASLGHGHVEEPPAFIEALLVKVLEKFTPDTLVTMTFRKAHFTSGHDLKDFAEKLGIALQIGEVEQ